MDEIKTRLRETSDACFKCYESWSANKKDSATREALLEAIHELRKVASRLEIEVAVSERDEMALRPIPIPPHRDAQRRGRGPDEAYAGDDNDSQRGQGGHGGRHHGGLRRRMGGGGGGMPRRDDNSGNSDNAGNV
ncbi:MAG: hypothetical protein L6Q57_09460 [Alphaproteobacteria bacterium]|nr:hypothetical protein [Alphaproteobacteria bacterium]